MIVPHATPAQIAAAPSILDLVAQATRRTTPTLDQAIQQACAQANLRQEQALASQIRDLVGGRPLEEAIDATTDHAWLVLLGAFAHRLGLIAALQTVPIAQRTRDHTPQTKLIQFLIGVLAGLAYLQDFNDAPHPLVTDQAVISSWGQSAFAHYASVSRTLAAADDTTLQAVMAVLEQISQPFLAREMAALLQQGQPLLLDVDLAGRPVSPTSTSYPDASFGWMDDGLHKGYQAAIATLCGGPTGRFLLSSQRFSGQMSSATALPSVIAAAEAVLGLHPRRRVELVQARLTASQQQLHVLEGEMRSARVAQHQAWQTQVRSQRLCSQAEQALALLPATPPGSKRLAQAQADLARAVRRVKRAKNGYARQVRKVQQLEEQWGQQQQAHSALLQRLQRLRAENQSGVAAVTVVIRLDAGFSTEANLAWLIEQGYTIYTKVHNGQTTSRLRRNLAEGRDWERVGRNAEALYLGAQLLRECPYALEGLLVRYQLPSEQQYTILWYYGDEARPSDLRAWFGQYNGRQVLEAGIKEGKAVFTMRRPLVRSAYGMQLQEQFAGFAANFVRWAAQWAKQQVVLANTALSQALGEVKTLVRVVAQSRARLVQQAAGGVLIFDAQGPFAGAVLRLWGAVVYQEVLPLFCDDHLRSHEPT